MIDRPTVDCKAGNEERQFQLRLESRQASSGAMEIKHRLAIGSIFTPDGIPSMWMFERWISFFGRI
jgi:hypothetical protein